MRIPGWTAVAGGVLAAIAGVLAVGQPPRASGAPRTVDWTAEVAGPSRSLPVLVTYSASWCPPCHLLDAELAAVLPRFAGRVMRVDIDVDANPRLADDAAYPGLPYAVLVRDGAAVDGFAGYRPRELLAEWLESRLGPAPAPP